MSQISKSSEKARINCKKVIANQIQQQKKKKSQLVEKIEQLRKSQ